MIQANVIAEKIPMRFNEIFEDINAEEFTHKRGERRRLKKAQLLRSETSLHLEDSQSEFENELVKFNIESDQDEEETNIRDAGVELLDLAIPYTEKKSAIFVSNHQDSELEQALKNGLRLNKLDWHQNGPREVQSVAKKISENRYDFVLQRLVFSLTLLTEVYSHLVKKLRFLTSE